MRFITRSAYHYNCQHPLARHIIFSSNCDVQSMLIQLKPVYPRLPITRSSDHSHLRVNSSPCNSATSMN